MSCKQMYAMDAPNFQDGGRVKTKRQYSLPLLWQQTAGVALWGKQRVQMKRKIKRINIIMSSVARPDFILKLYLTERDSIKYLCYMSKEKRIFFFFHGETVTSIT